MRKIAFIVSASLLFTPNVFADVLSDIKAKEASIASLTQQLQPAIAPIVVKGADLRASLSLTPIVDLSAKLNNLPAGSRSFSLASNGTNNSHLWSDGPTWCNSFVDLTQSNVLTASGELSGISAAIRDDGSIALSSTVSISGHGQVYLQFKGKRVYPAGIHIGGGTCPLGDGAALPNRTGLGVNFSKGAPVTLVIAFSNDPKSNTVGYSARIEQPRDSISVTGSVGFAPIGSVGIPMTINVPGGAIASGSFPLGLANSGTFQLPEGAGKRDYDFVLTPVSFATNKDGLAASWKTVVQFRP
jgi:hypothetical protein